MADFRTVLTIPFLLFFASSSFPEPTQIIEHGPRDGKKIALTFDACPTGRPEEYDPKVMELLVREKVPATLFISGRWAEKNPDKVKYLSEQPLFEIANHSYYHPHMMEKDDARITREIRRTQAIIKKLTGKKPRYFRAPYGEIDERVARLAAESGLTTIQYDIASGDPDPNLSAERIVRRALRDVRGGSIIVFHMNGNGLRTAEALPELIRALRQKGFQLVTVSELLHDKSL